MCVCVCVFACVWICVAVCEIVFRALSSSRANGLGFGLGSSPDVSGECRPSSLSPSLPSSPGTVHSTFSCRVLTSSLAVGVSARECLCGGYSAVHVGVGVCVGGCSLLLLLLSLCGRKLSISQSSNVKLLYIFTFWLRDEI